MYYDKTNDCLCQICMLVCLVCHFWKNCRAWRWDRYTPAITFLELMYTVVKYVYFFNINGVFFQDLHAIDLLQNTAKTTFRISIAILSFQIILKWAYQSWISLRYYTFTCMSYVKIYIEVDRVYVLPAHVIWKSCGTSKQTQNITVMFHFLVGLNTS